MVEGAGLLDQLPELNSHSSYDLIPNFETFRGICYLKKSLPLHSVNDSSIAIFCPGKYKLKFFVDIGQKGIDIEKFRRTLVSFHDVNTCKFALLFIDLD
jgi:hypothetical protein